jgi:hypothetical protein
MKSTLSDLANQMLKSFVIAGLTFTCLFSTVTRGQASAPTIPASRNAVSRQTAAGPSLNETTTWIKNALATYGHVRYSSDGTTVDSTQALSSVHGCEATFDVLTTTQGIGKYSLTVSVNFKDLDPASGKAADLSAGSAQSGSWSARAMAVGFQTSNLAQLVEFKYTTSIQLTNYLSPEDGYKTGMSLAVNGEDAASRLMKAMSHAIALCGGKKSTTF